MDICKIRSITNRYQDVHLVSRQSWRNAGEILPRDHGGPYMVGQEGYDPSDLTATPDEFVLGKCGKWMALSDFFTLPLVQRRDEFVFGTAVEVIELLESLPGAVEILRAGEPASTVVAVEVEEDELNAVFLDARTSGSATPLKT